MKTKALLCASWMAVAAAVALPVAALEVTAGGNSAAQSTLGLDLKMDALNAALTSTINRILACANQGRTYVSDESVPGRDAAGCVTPPALDVANLRLVRGSPSIFRLGKRARADELSAEQVCREGGFTAVLELENNQYESPDDNKVAYWDGAAWRLIKAKGNRHISKLVCYRFTM